jgi:hypothetical protein
MSIEIKRIDGTVAYESQSATSLKEAAEEAVRQGVSLARANCSEANFSGADFSRANFSGAEGILHVGPVDGWDMYAVRWDDGPRIKAGCRWFTVSEAREWWGKGGEPGNKPEHGPLMLAGVEALVALARAHGWEMPPRQEVAA